MAAKTVVSYATVDRPFVLKLAAELRAAGIDLWVDALEIQKGARWDDEIDAALRTCSQLLVVLSPASVASHNVKDEIAVALRRGVRVVPILHKDCEVPLRIERLQRVDFTKDYAAGVDELVQALGGAEGAAVASTTAAVEAELVPAPPEARLHVRPPKSLSAGTSRRRALILGGVPVLAAAGVSAWYMWQPKPVYYLVANLRSEGDWLDVRSQLAAKGLKPQYFVKAGGHRIKIGPYSSLGQAQQTRSQVDAVLGSSPLWGDWTIEKE